MPVVPVLTVMELLEEAAVFFAEAGGAEILLQIKL
jgi:hypothetical protein